MAQRVQVLLVDDIDGGEAEETVSFGLDGATYEVDLSAENAEQLREALAPYVESGRKVGGRRRRRAARSAGGQAATTAEVREWAMENGWDISPRGRLSKEVRDAYAAAH
ncbi:MAG: Lsr2 family protein [Propionibacteriales bacterium]|nr:Lsr2 family protein [Propionibacteriales bacterium]